MPEHNQKQSPSARTDEDPTHNHKSKHAGLAAQFDLFTMLKELPMSKPESTEAEPPEQEKSS